MRDRAVEALETLHSGATLPYEVISVNDGGPAFDEEVVALSDKVVVYGKNRGYAAAVNAGARAAEGAVLVIVNNDTWAPREWDAPLVAKLADPTVGVAFPLVKNKEDADFRAQLAGCFFAIRRETWDQVGGLNEEYGRANFEDTELFARIQYELGLKLVAVPECRVHHYGRGTLEKIEPAVNPNFDRNKAIYESRFGDKYPFLA